MTFPTRHTSCGAGNASRIASVSVRRSALTGVCDWRRRDERDPMKSPDTSSEMGKYRKRGNRIRPFSANRAAHTRYCMRAAWLSRMAKEVSPLIATSGSSFYPLTKEYAQPLILAFIKNTGNNAALLNDPATLMLAVPQREFGKLPFWTRACTATSTDFSYDEVRVSRRIPGSKYFS